MVHCVLEFAENRLLVATRTSVLLFDNRQFIKEFANLNTLHIPRGEFPSVLTFEKMPGFDAEKYPFVACQSQYGIKLLNLKTDNIETLIIAK